MIGPFDNPPFPMFYRLLYLLHLLNDFLGITLDSMSFQASLPSEKIQRITLLLLNDMQADKCTKRQLLALLGHLNYNHSHNTTSKTFLVKPAEQSCICLLHPRSIGSRRCLPNASLATFLVFMEWHLLL